MDVCRSSTRLKVGRTIGRGGFGEVRFAHWNGQSCAVKVFFVSQDEVARSEIAREVKILQKLHHRHVIQFHRETVVQGRLAFIMEFAENGSLQKAIRTPGRLDWGLKERIAQGIIRGLAHIHSEGIIHCDLKSANVLLDKYMEAKLCDFGLAAVRSLSTSKVVMECPKGSVRWMAPELFVGAPKYTTKTDMFALGCILWEMAAECTPPFKEQLIDTVVIDLVKNGVRETIPTNIPEHYRGWIEQCWDEDPTTRPVADDLVAVEAEPDEDDWISELGFSSSSCMIQNNLTEKSSSVDPPHLLSLAVVNDQGAQFLRDSSVGPQGSDHQSDDDLLEQEDNNSKDSLFSQGEKHLMSNGASQCDFEALVCFHRAAQKGHVEAQFRIGRMYDFGQVITKDTDRAKLWYQKAALNGHPQAERSLRALDGLDKLIPISTDNAGRPVLPDSTQLRSFKIGSRLDAQDAGFVYHAQWAGRHVAAKKIFLDNTGDDMDAIQQEIAMLQRLKSSHVLRFYGVVHHRGSPYLVMEYVSNGSLDEAIIKQSLDSSSKWRIAREIARGLEYIHSRGVLHRDLKSDNIMLTRDMEAKLCDFGLATIKTFSTAASKRDQDTVRWMAPELFVAKPKYTEVTDIYALGMILWELAANCTMPFRDTHDNLEVLAMVKRGEREALPNQAPVKLLELIQQCWDADSAQRPTADNLVSYLEEISDDSNDESSFEDALTDYETDVSEDEAIDM